MGLFKTIIYHTYMVIHTLIVIYNVMGLEYQRMEHTANIKK